MDAGKHEVAKAMKQARANDAVIAREEPLHVNIREAQQGEHPPDFPLGPLPRPSAPLPGAALSAGLSLGIAAGAVPPLSAGAWVGAAAGAPQALSSMLAIMRKLTMVSKVLRDI